MRLFRIVAAFPAVEEIGIWGATPSLALTLASDFCDRHGRPVIGGATFGVEDV
jgi:hypothetical protein